MQRSSSSSQSALQSASASSPRSKQLLGPIMRKHENGSLFEKEIEDASAHQSVTSAASDGSLEEPLEVKSPSRKSPKPRLEKFLSRSFHQIEKLSSSISLSGSPSKKEKQKVSKDQSSQLQGLEPPMSPAKPRRKFFRSSSGRIVDDSDVSTPESPRTKMKKASSTKVLQVEKMTKAEVFKVLKAYGWYARLGQPSRSTFKKLIPKTKDIDVSEDDGKCCISMILDAPPNQKHTGHFNLHSTLVDLLPWVMNGTLVNVARINKIIAAAAKVGKSKK